MAFVERISFITNRIKHKLNKLCKFIVSKDLQTSVINMKLLVNLIVRNSRLLIANLDAKSSNLKFCSRNPDFLLSYVYQRNHRNYQNCVKQTIPYVSATNMFSVITNNLSGSVYGPRKLCVGAWHWLIGRERYFGRSWQNRSVHAFPQRQFRWNATVEVSSRHLQCNNWTAGTITG